MKPICIALFLFLASSLSAQNLGADMPFFQKKTAVYKRWLETTGLGSVLSVDRVRLKPRDSSELELLLVIHTSDVDSAVGLWQQLTHDFQTTTNRSLTTALYRQFVSIMEIPASKGNVQIYAKGSTGRYLPCFFVWTWEKDGSPRDSLHVGQCKNQPLDIAVPALPIRKISKGKVTEVIRVKPAETVFGEILTYVNNRYPSSKYNGTNCSGRYPKLIKDSQTETRLIFAMEDLCREVITNQNLSTWCSLARSLGFEKDCNDIIRERLEFEFNYEKTSKGYRLTGILRGKFGSGVYYPRSGGYMDMDPDFLDFEYNFSRIFQEDLQKYLAGRP